MLENWQESFDGESFDSQSRFDPYAGLTQCSEQVMQCSDIEPKPHYAVFLSVAKLKCLALKLIWFVIIPDMNQIGGVTEVKYNHDC